MGRDDWYRHKTWDDAIEESFFARLERSRGRFHKAQYLRIQAHYLTSDHPAEAMKLLDMIISDFPEPTELAQTYLQKAHCLVAMSKAEEAIHWFREVFQQEAERPSVQTCGYLDFPTFVVSQERRDLYGEAKGILEKHAGRPTFPIDHYRWNSAMAIIEWDGGHTERARSYACAAIDAAAQEHSGFRYHRAIGLVEEQDERLQKLLIQIAEGKPTGAVQ